MRAITYIILALALFNGTRAQYNYEPGVILLQVKQPEIVSFNNGQVINGSPQLQAVFEQYPATRSRKLSHVNAETNGCYRIEYPRDYPVMNILNLLTNCPDIKHATLNK